MSKSKTASPKPRMTRAARHQQIIRLRKQNYTTPEIAAALGYKPSTISREISALIRSGHVHSRRPRWTRSTNTWRNPRSRRVQTIARMVKKGASRGKIGLALGVTSRRVGDLIDHITREHGEDFLATDAVLLTGLEAAKELNVHPEVVYRLCQNGTVPARRRGSGTGGPWVIDEACMNALRTRLKGRLGRACVVCNTPFDRDGTSALTCSEECQDIRKRQRRAALLAQTPSLDSLSGWHRKLWQRLQSHRIPRREKWLPHKAAMQQSGLSSTQLNWLRLRGIATVRLDPARVATRTGEPLATYAASEMKIVRHVYSAWKRQQKRKRRTRRPKRKK